MTYALPTQSIGEYITERRKTAFGKIDANNDSRSLTKRKKINLIAKSKNIVELNLSDLNLDHKINVNLFCHDELMGAVKITCDHLTIEIKNSEFILKIMGTTETPNVSIKSSGELIIAGLFKRNQLVEMEAAKVSLQTPLLSKNISIVASKELVCNASIDAINIFLQAYNVSLHENIYANFLKVEARNQLSNVKNLIGKVFNILEASLINNKGGIRGERVNLSALDAIENDGEIIACFSLKFKASTLVDHGKISSKGKLKFNCNKVNTTTTSEISAKTHFKFVGQQLDHNGQMALRGVALFSIDQLNIAGRFELPDQAYVHANYLTVKSGTTLKWLVNNDHPKTRIIKTNNETIVEKNSVLTLQTCQFFTNKLEIVGKLDIQYSSMKVHSVSMEGDFNAKESFLQTQEKLVASNNANIKISNSSLQTKELLSEGIWTTHQSYLKIEDILKTTGKFFSTHSLLEIKKVNLNGMTDCRNSQIKVTEDIITHTKERIQFIGSELQARVLRTEDSGEFQCQDSQITTNVINASCPFKFSASDITTKSFLQLSSGMLEKSKINATSSFSQKATAKLTIDNSFIKTPSAHIHELIAQQESLLDMKQADVDKKFTLNKSSVKGELLIGNQSSQLLGNSESVWVISSMQLDGKGSFEDSYLEVKSFSNNGETRIKKSRIKAEKLLRAHGQFIIDDTIINANSLDLNKNYQINTSMIDANITIQKGDGSFDKCAVNSRFINALDKAKITTVNSSINTEFGHFKGNVNLTHCNVTAQTISQANGKMQLTDKTVMTVSEAISTAENSEFNINDSLLQSAKDKQLIGCFEGKINANHSMWSFRNLHILGQLMFKESLIEVQSKLGLYGSEQTIKQSSLTARTISLSGETSIEKSQLKSRQISILKDGKVCVTEAKFEADENMTVFGTMSMTRSKLLANDIEVYKELKLLQSEANATNTFMSHSDANLICDETKLNAEKMYFYHVEATKSHLHATDKIIFNYQSKNRLNEVMLEANDSIAVEYSSTIKGRSVMMKTNSMTNRGKIKLDGLSIDVEVLDNHGGKIDGGKNLKIDANKALINFTGQIRADNTIVNTGCCLNFVGDIAGNDNLTLNSLLNLNLFGLYRSYNANINSLLDTNFGLVLPTIPSSPSALFSPQHLLSFGRIVLTNIFPKMSAGINLAFRVLPLAWQVSKSIYDVASDSNKSWSDLLPNINFSNSDNIRLKDILPAVLTIKNLVITGTGFYNSVQGFSQEYKDYSWSSISEQIKGITPQMILNSVGTGFGPTLMQDSVISLNAGIAASQNVIKTDWFSLNTGIEAGWQSLTHNTHTMKNSGLIAGIQTNLTGTHFTNAGIVTDSNKMYMQFDTVNNAGQIIGHNAFIHATTFDNLNDIELDNHSRIAVENLNNHKDSTLTVSDQSILNAEHFENAGTTTIDKSHLDIKQDIRVTQSGKLHVYDSTIKAKNVVIEDGLAEFKNHPVFPQNETRTSTQEKEEQKNTHYDIELESKMVVTEKGKLILENVSMQADGIDESGHALVKNSYLHINQDVHIAKTGNLLVTQSAMETKRLIVDGRAEFKNDANKDVKKDQETKEGQASSEITTPQEKIQKDLTVNEDVIVNEGGQFITDNIVMVANKAQYHGHVEHNDSQLQLSQDLNLTKKAELTLTNSSVLTQTTHIQGKLNATASLLKTQQDIVAAKDSQINATSSAVEGKNIQLEGKMNLEKTVIEAQDDIQIKDKTEISAKECLIKANMINYEGKTQLSGYFGLDAKEKLITSTTSSIQLTEKSENNLLELKAKTADLNGSVNVDNASLNIQNLPGAEDFIMRKGKYSSFIATNNLAIKTDAHIELTKPIERSCGLDIEAKSIQVKTDYHTTHNLHFKSTEGDVGLYSNLSAQNICADSANYLYTSRSLQAKEIIGLKAKGEYLNLSGFIAGDIVSIEASAIKNFHYQSHILATLPPHLRGLVGDNGSIVGREVYLEATQTNVENHGGLLKGTAYLQAVAKQDIINEANVKTQQGKYDVIKTFDPAIINGGVGLDDNHVGLYLQAGNKVINTGSTIISQGNNCIKATKGFESVAQSHTFVSDHKKEKKWHKKKEKTQTSTIVQNSEVISTGGKNTILCEDGSILAIATNFVSKDGTQAYAKGNIELYSLKYVDKTTTKKEKFWGLKKSKKTESHEQAVPVLIFDHGVTRLESMEGNIIGRGVVALGDGVFQTSAKNGSVLFSSDKLQHHIHEKKSGLSISCPGVQQFTSMLKSGPKGILGHIDPTVDKINNLIHSGTGIEWAANSWNAALASYNSYQTLMHTPLLDLMSQRFGVDGLLHPSLDLTFSKSEQKTSFETNGPGLIQRRSWEIEAGDKVSIQGVDVNIAENMTVKAKTFELKGQELKSKMSYESKSLSLGVTATGEVVNAAANYTKQTATSTHYQNMHMRVGGNLHVEVDNWHLSAANLDTGTLTGVVKNELHIQSQQDKYHNELLSASASSNGQVSFFQSKAEGAHINEATSIHVRNGINHEAEHQFSVKTTINEGAKITSDGVNNFRSEVIINHEVKDYDRQRSFGISGNLNDIANAFRTTEKHDLNKTINTMTVSHSSEDFVGVQSATYHGKAATHIESQMVIGGMNTADANGYHVVCDKKQTVALDVPIVNPNLFFTPKKVQAEEKFTEGIESKTNEPSATLEATEDVATEDDANTTDNKSEDSQEDSVSNEQISHDSEVQQESSQTANDSNNNPTTSNKLEDVLIEGGAAVLAIKQQEIATMLEKMGASKVAKIFNGLGYGLVFAQNLYEEKKNHNEDYLQRAIIRTLVEAPLTLSWRLGLPLQLLSMSTEKFTEELEKRPDAFINKEMWEKYGADESLRFICPELFENESLQECYGASKGIQWIANFPRNAGKFAADKITELQRKYTWFGKSATHSEKQKEEQVSNNNNQMK